MRLLLLSLCVALTRAQLGDWENYQLIWEDQFDGDLSKWQHEVTAWGGGNSEFQVYTPDADNTYILDGAVHIKPTPLVQSTNPLNGQPFGEDFLTNGVLDLHTMYGSCTVASDDGCYREGANRAIPPIMSGKLKTRGSFSFTYGRVRMRIKMPTGDWMWPAIWLKPSDEMYGSWPKSGEIKLMESVGNEDLKWWDGAWAGHQKMGTTLHWGPNYDANRWDRTHTTIFNESSNYGHNWHTFDFDWSEDGMRFLVDDEDIMNVPDPLIPLNPEWNGFWDFGSPFPGYQNPGWSTLTAPFDKPFYFVLNVAIGGTNGYMPEGATNRGGDLSFSRPWTNSQSYYDAFNSFWENESNWSWTWVKEGEGAALQVDYIEVYKKIV